jgi:hypothetical protein
VDHRGRFAGSRTDGCCRDETATDAVRSSDHPGRNGPEVTAVDHSRCLPSLILALVSAAALTVTGSEAPGRTGASSQVVGGAATVPAGKTPKTGSASETLRHAAKGRFLIGAAVSPHGLDDARLAELAARLRQRSSPGFG